MSAALRILRARRIHTLDPACPLATHVAVRDGRIAGVGSAESLQALGPAELDDSLGDRVLLPGFVEGHAHADAGGMWRFAYVGQYDRRDPRGRVWPGLRSVDELVERLRGEAAGSRVSDTVFAFGADPIFLDRSPTRHDLDRVSAHEPVAVINCSGHILYLNTEALRRTGLLPPVATHEGLPLGADGLPLGELRGGQLIGPAARQLGVAAVTQGADTTALEDFARMCVMTGVTTVTDLASAMDAATWTAMDRVSRRPDWPVRLVPALYGQARPPAELVALAQGFVPRGHDLLRTGAIKVVLDGSIQGFTARLRAGRYAGGEPNGLWYLAPEWLSSLLRLAYAARRQVHIHTNGDQASELALQLVAGALADTPWPEHRTILQHAQLMDEGQMRQALALGVGVNLFANHLYYWGEAHATRTVGEAAAARMNAAGTAQRIGLPFGLHSDAPVTPIGPLFTAWCAVNRQTSAGRVLGPDERLSVAQALHAVTLGSAWTLGLEREIGSISPGKSADFAVLADDPFECPPHALREVAVCGTVCRGTWTPA